MIGADDGATLFAAAPDLGEIGLGRDLVAAERIGGDVLNRNGPNDRLVRADEQPAAFARMLGRGVRRNRVEGRLRDNDGSRLGARIAIRYFRFRQPAPR